MKILFKYILIVCACCLLSCSETEQKNTESETTQDECSIALKDQTILSLLETNKNRIAQNYSGVLAGKYPTDSTRTQFLLYFYNGELFSYESFYLNGNLKLLKPIRCNSASGTLEYYYKDGALNYTLELFMGRKNGEGIEYYPNGKVKKLRYFTNDTLDGNQYEFDENGDTLLVTKYEMGKEIMLP